MNLRPVHLLIPLVGIALGLLVPFEKPKLPVKKKRPGAEAAVAGVGGKWSDARFLTERMEEACAWVKEASGMEFLERPTARASTAEDIVPFLSADMGKAFRTLGAKDAEGVRSMARSLADQMVAAYDPKENVVHVLPQNAVAAAEAAGDEGLLDPNILRLVLVRMGVIAIDRQILTDWKAALDAATSIDAVHCAGAVLEGHAQYETARIAKTWANQERGFDSDTFDRLVMLLRAPPPADATPAQKALASEGGFALLKGHAFMKAMAKKRVPGIKGVISKPPTDRNHILKPAAYLATFVKKRVSALPGKILKEFASLMPEADGWTITSEPCPTEDVEMWMTPLSKGMWSGEAGAFIKGTKWTARGPDGAGTMLYLLSFRTGGMAESYTNLAKAAAEKNGDKVESGAGRDGGLIGYAATRVADGKTNAIQLTVEGKMVLAFVTSVGANREPWDDAIEAAAEVLAKAQKSRVDRKNK